MLKKSSLERPAQGGDTDRAAQLNGRDLAPAVDEASRNFLRSLAGAALQAGVVLAIRQPSGGLSIALGDLEKGHKGVAARLGLPDRKAAGVTVEGATFAIEDDRVVVDGISTTYGGITSATIGDEAKAHRQLSEFLTTLWRGK